MLAVLLLLALFQFLRSWLDECNRVLLKKSRTAMPKTISEEITREFRQSPFMLVSNLPVYKAVLLKHFPRRR